jgi:hypothetical protein
LARDANANSELLLQKQGLSSLYLFLSCLSPVSFRFGVHDRFFPFGKATERIYFLISQKNYSTALCRVLRKLQKRLGGINVPPTKPKLNPGGHLPVFVENRMFLHPRVSQQAKSSSGELATRYFRLANLILKII